MRESHVLQVIDLCVSTRLAAYRLASLDGRGTTLHDVFWRLAHKFAPKNRMKLWNPVIDSVRMSKDHGVSCHWRWWIPKQQDASHGRFSRTLLPIPCFLRKKRLDSE